MRMFQGLRGLAVMSAVLLLLGCITPAYGLERLCDSSHENCRTEVLDRIRSEQVEIDVGLWFMEDSRWASALIERWNAGVKVRIIMDARADAQHPVNHELMRTMADAGIPMRRRTASGIEHWKAVVLAGQDIVYFGSANFSVYAWVPNDPYVDYVDETVYGTDDPSVVQSFMRKFDDAWVNTGQYANYANASSPARRYPLYSIDPELNFTPEQSFATRSVGRYNAETQGIDAVMYRITDRRHSDAIIAARARGVPVRMIVEPQQYRDDARLWHSWNVDRLYMAGVQLRNRAHQGLNHQKTTLLYGQGMTIFGSSNWTTASSDRQHEHNYFTHKSHVFAWFAAQFNRKWNNANPRAAVETVPFTPLPPDKPVYHTPSPGNGAAGVSTTGLKLTWYGGPWAHLYDIYLGTTPDPPLFAADQALGPSQSTSQKQSFTLPELAGGTTYYWRIVAKTMALVQRGGDVWSFSTSGQGGSAPVPPAAPTCQSNADDTHLDFDGDGCADIGVWRGGTGEWFVLRSSARSEVHASMVAWGSSSVSDVPVPADYDGDGRTDVAVWRRSSGQWFILPSGNGFDTRSPIIRNWGSGVPPYNDVPVPADYDGDGRADIAVWRPGTGEWLVLRTRTGSAWTVHWGAGTPPYNDVPVPADYDGDRRADVAIWRPASGTWYVRRSTAPGSGALAVQWGSGRDPYRDRPVPQDYDGDGRTDMAIWRPSTGTWHVRRSGGSTLLLNWGSGAPGYDDRPVPADYDGDGRADLTVWRPALGVWFVLPSGQGYAESRSWRLQWGSARPPYLDQPLLRR